MREATPDNVVVALQEELIAVKLREAEATLALKELRPKIAELTSQWLRHLQVAPSIRGNSNRVQTLQSDLLN